MVIFYFIIVYSAVCFLSARWHVKHLATQNRVQPACALKYYGWTLMLWNASASLGLYGVLAALCPSPWVLWIIWGTSTLIFYTITLKRLTPGYHARLHLEIIIRFLLKVASAFTVMITLMILGVLMWQSYRFFTLVPIHKFLFGLHRSSHSASHLSPLQIQENFGVVPLISGTFLITSIALTVAIPMGLFIAIFTSEIAQDSMRKTIKPIVEMLAGVPTILYGFFALIVVAPALHQLGVWLDIPIAAESALGAGLVMSLMVIPLISSLSDDALVAVPKSLRENSWALGATFTETVLKVVLPAAFPGIMSAILLAFSRAVGETMLVVMAAGLTAHLTANPFHSVTTMTVQIVTLLTGDQEFDSPQTLSAFALGLLLFIGTLMINMVASRISRWHRARFNL